MQRRTFRSSWGTALPAFAQGPSRRRRLELVRQRIIVISLFTWLPLMVLSALEGQALGGRAAVPFLLDLEVHIKFLIVVPLLIISELVVHQRMRFVVKQFLERNLIPESALPRFDAAIASAFRLRNSVLAEVLLIAFVYVVGVLIIWRQYTALATATWYAVPTGRGFETLAQRSVVRLREPADLPVPIDALVFSDLHLDALSLEGVTHRLEPHPHPSGPRRRPGISFQYGLCLHPAGRGTRRFACRIHRQSNFLPWGRTASVQDRDRCPRGLCAVHGTWSCSYVFAPQLAEAKRKGNREYGTLAERYVREFDAKWLRGGAPADEPLVGSGDIQSLADLSNSFEVVRTMRIAPVTKEAILRLVAATLAPVVPLALTMMPLEELLKKLIGIVF